MEREQVFDFTEKPTVKILGADRYEIAFAVKGYCDATVGIVDADGKVVRHLGSGVLGPNAPVPFQKNSLKQTLYWNGKDDLGDYPKTPEKLRVRVMLGLKPVFDKRLGGTSPKNLPGEVHGLAIDSTGAYVFVYNGGDFKHMTAWKFDRDGNYMRTFFPPAAGTPEEKLAGTSYIEYEPGKRSWHGVDVGHSMSHNGLVFAFKVNYKQAELCQLAIAGKRIVFLNRGSGGRSAFADSLLFYINTDGSTDVNGMRGMPFDGTCHVHSGLAASPDGKWIYMIAIKKHKNTSTGPVVLRAPADGSQTATILVGEANKPGNDNAHLNGPTGIDCDSQGRIYVADSMNHRIQVYSPDGKYLSSIKVDRPSLVRVHQKTGAIYVQHQARIEGRSVPRLTKLTSFEKPTEAFHVDQAESEVMAIDSWSENPRLWIARPGLKIYEERGNKLHLMSDFDEAAQKEAGKSWFGRWAGDCFDKVVCDPVREQLYYRNSHVFDLKMGELLGIFSSKTQCVFDDMAFDKRGYMHLHFNPCFFGQGVGRVDPLRVSVEDKAKGQLNYPECPYDYGVETRGWLGVLPVKDQPGAKGFQDGLGVTMRGEIVSQSNIYYVPKMEEEGMSLAIEGIAARKSAGAYDDNPRGNYTFLMNEIMEKQKRGEEVYAIKRKPGIPLAGGTAWTYDATGELRRECAVLAGDLINGVQMDEDLAVYFVNARPKIYQEKPFLYNKAGLFGTKDRAHPFTGTLIKTKPDTGCAVLLASASVPMDELPKRPPDLMALNYMEDVYMGKGSWSWVEGAEWLYAGASPIVDHACSCPRQHLGLDWYKRVYVPEAYRHSIGILDTNGNLIMHLGRYGNFDDAPGGKDGAKPGGEDIRILLTRFVSATDNYLVYGDWAEKLVSLRLEYHAEESVGIK